MPTMAVRGAILLLWFLILDSTQGYTHDSKYNERRDSVDLVAALKGVSRTLECLGDVTRDTLQSQTRNNDDFKSVGDLLNESLRIHRSNSNTLSDMGRLLRLVEELSRDMDEMKTNPANDCVKETTFNKEVEELRKKLEVKDRQTEEIVRQLEAKDRKVLEATRQNAVLETKLLHEGEKVMQLTRENEDLTTKLTNEAKQVEALTREINGIKTQQADECNQDVSHVDEIIDLKKQLGDKENQVKDLVRERSNLQTQLVDESYKVKVLKRENQELKSRPVEDCDQNESHIDELADVREQLDGKEKQVESLEKSLKESQKEVEELTQQVNNLRKSDTKCEQPPKCEPPEQIIKEQVDAYSRKKNWAALRRGLGELLSDDSEAYKQLMGVRSGYTSPLFEVVHRGYTELVTLLLCHGLPADTAGSNKFTMLHASAMTGQVELMQLLIQHGADINAKDISGRTAIMKAEDEGRWTVVEWMLRNGAQSSTVRSDGHGGVIVNGRAMVFVKDD